MKKIFTMLFLVVAVFAFATTGRMNGLLAPYWAVEDNSNVLYFPSLISEYNNSVRLEGLSDSAFFGGIHKKLSETLDFSLYVNKPYTNDLDEIWNQPGGKDTNGIHSGTRIPTNYIDLLFSFNFNSLRLGILLNYANNSDNSTSTDINQPNPVGGNTDNTMDDYSREFNLILNVSMDNFAMFKKFLAALDFGLPKHKYNEHNLSYVAGDWDLIEWKVDTKGATYIGIRMLSTTEKGYNFFLNFHLNGLNHDSEYIRDDDSDGTLETNTIDEIEQSIMRLKLGVSKKLAFKKLTVYAGGSIDYEKNKWHSKDIDKIDKETDEEYNRDITDIKIPVFVSAEFILKKWLTLRAGINGYILDNENTKINNPDWAANAVTNIIDTETKSSSAGDCHIMLGGTFSFNKINVDIAVDPVLLTNTFLLSGWGLGTPIATASATYNW